MDHQKNLVATAASMDTILRISASCRKRARNGEYFFIGASTPTPGNLMGFYSDLMGFYGDLMGFHSDSMGCL